MVNIYYICFTLQYQVYIGTENQSFYLLIGML